MLTVRVYRTGGAGGQGFPAPLPPTTCQSSAGAAAHPCRLHASPPQVTLSQQEAQDQVQALSGL